jgi:hypothetical protein
MDKVKLKEIWSNRISKSKLQSKDKIPYWIHLIKMKNYLKRFLFDFNLDYLVFKDRKVYDKEESKHFENKHDDIMAILSERHLFNISLNQFNKIKLNSVIISDRTEKQISDITINLKSKSRVIKGLSECIFHLKHETTDFDYLEIEDFKLTQSDKQFLVKRLEHEIRKSLNLKSKDKLPTIPEEYKDYVNPPEYIENKKNL